MGINDNGDNVNNNWINNGGMLKMNKIRVIDLLNKIANGEEVPKKIKYDAKEMEYDHNKQDYLGYYSNGNGEWLFQYLFDRCRNTEHFINDEVKVIEEPKKMEKYYNFLDTSSKDMKSLRSRVNELTDSINEIIDKINEGE